MPVYLVENDGEKDGHRWELEFAKPVHLGRLAEGVNITVPHRSISRKHVLLEVQPPISRKVARDVFGSCSQSPIVAVVKVRDLQSVNGTFLGRARLQGVTQYVLHHPPCQQRSVAAEYSTNTTSGKAPNSGPLLQMHPCCAHLRFGDCPRTFTVVYEPDAPEASSKCEVEEEEETETSLSPLPESHRAQESASPSPARRRKIATKWDTVTDTASSNAASLSAVSANGRSAMEKRRLLWRKKAEETAAKEERPGDDAPTAGTATDATKYSASFHGDSAKQKKFLKLMGHGAKIPTDDPPQDSLPQSAPLRSTQEQKLMESELEFHFFQGMKRKDGRKTGLGL